MTVESITTQADRLLANADDNEAEWRVRAAALITAAELVMDAVIMSDEVAHLDRLLYVGDGVVKSALMKGTALNPPDQLLVTIYLIMAETYLETFEFRMQVGLLRNATACLDTATGLHSLLREPEPIQMRRSAVISARVAVYQAETFALDVNLRPHMTSLKKYGPHDQTARAWLARCLRLSASGMRDPSKALDEAVRILQGILMTSTTDKTSPWLEASLLAELTTCQTALYEFSSLPYNLNLAMELSRLAVTKQRSSIPAGCARARTLRIAFETSAGGNLQEIDDWHMGFMLRNGRNWHGWLLSRGYAAWCRDTDNGRGAEQADYAYDYALAVAESELAIADRRLWLRELGSLLPLVTDRLVDMGMINVAGCKLERSRGLILRERLADEYAELKDITASGHGALAAAMREALNASRSSQLSGRAQDAVATRLLQITDQLRRVPGYERFRMWPEPQEVIDNIGGETLVYLIPGLTGGWIVGHSPSSGWFHGNLPLCRTDEMPAPVVQFRRATRESQLPAGFRRRAVEEICLWLWTAVYLPLRSYIQAETCYIVAHGYLADLPIHAARATREDDAGVMEERRIRYVPSARALASSRRALENSDPNDQVMLAIPPSTNSRIPAAVREMELVARWFPRAVVFPPQNQSAQAVSEAAQTSGWLHAACHAQADSKNPLRSGLLLENDQRFTLGDLARGTIGHLTLAVLSACQTAVTDAELPEENLSLAAGFLVAGCGSVVASSWPVPDSATGELMTLFYQAWRGDGLQPSDALHTAQLRLARNLKWQHPYYWAGFQYLGW